jgi:hypothetical protein
VVLVDEPAG